MAGLVALVTCTDRFTEKPVAYAIYELEVPRVWIHTNLGSGDYIGNITSIGDGYHTKVEERDEVYTHHLCSWEGHSIYEFTSYQACLDFIRVNMQRQNIQIEEA